MELRESPRERHVEKETNPGIPSSREEVPEGRKGTGLGDRLRQGIEEDILAGRLLPGDRLDERALAERYQVSRTPVREALRQLAMSGLVSLQPRQGARVATLELTDLLELMETMTVLEAEAARLAARRMSPQERVKLQSIHEQATQAVAAGDTGRFNELNWQLHHSIFEGSRNRFLASQARNLRLRVHFYRCYLLRVRDGKDQAQQQHDELVQAIVRGDGEAAFSAMREHLVLNAERMSDLVALLPRAAEPARAEEGSTLALLPG